MRLPGLQLLLLLAVLLGLGSGARFAEGSFFCRMMGRAVTECCCAHEAPRAQATHAAEMSAADCCERLSQAAHNGVAVRHDAGVQTPYAPVMLPLTWFEYPVRAVPLVSSRPALARAPPGLGPPLFIKHCAILS